MSGVVVTQVRADRSAPGVLYASTAQGGSFPAHLAKTVDGGGTWLPLARGLPVAFQPTALAVSPDPGRVVLAAGVQGLYRSTAAGSAWSSVRLPLPAITALLFDRSNPMLVLAGTELQGNFRSLDGGVTWRPANRGLHANRHGLLPGATLLVQDPREAGTFFMASNGFAGVYKSADAGVTWQPSGVGLSSTSLTDLAIDPSDPQKLFAVTAKGVAQSGDGGATWAALTSIPPIEPVAVQFDPDAKNTLYVAGAHGSLFRSTNEGASWVELPSLPRPVRSITAWSGLAGGALTAAAGEGVWQLRLPPTLPSSPEPAARNRQYFSETGHNVSPTFLPFLQSRGGVARFGFPRTDEMVEDGLLVQYFQRARLEYHPEFKNTAYEIQISLLGEWLLGQERPPRVEPFESGENQRFFPETGHSVNLAFLRYYVTRGGLDSLGYPISEELQENGRPVQYFQRARLEYHADLAGKPDEVQLGLIGDEVLKRRGWLD